MAEGRMLKKAISTSRKLAELKDNSARLLYTWLIPFLDVEGRYYGESDIIKGSIVPRIKDFTIQEVERCLQDMAQVGLILWYEIDGDKYLQLNCFTKHQNINKDREAKSIIPAPPDNLIFKGQVKGDVYTPSKSVNTPSKSVLPEDTDKDKDKEADTAKDKKEVEKKEKEIISNFYNQFKLFKMEELIEILTNNLKWIIRDWKEIFLGAYKSHPKTEILELAIMHLIISGVNPDYRTATPEKKLCSLLGSKLTVLSKEDFLKKLESIKNKKTIQSLKDDDDAPAYPPLNWD